MSDLVQCGSWALGIATVGSLLYLLRGYYRGAQFTEKVDASGKVAVVTGANTGIGMETARHLNLAGAKVYLLCRNEKKAKEAIADLVESGCDDRRLIYVQCDLANFETVRKCAEQILSQEKTIDILVNNAGIMGLRKFETTVDGHELTWQSNHLGHFLLTELLLPAIKMSKDGRIINVSSQLHTMGGALDLTTVDNEKGFGPIAPYSRSKLANVMHARELSRRLREFDIHNVSVNSLHPGAVDTTIAPGFILNRTPLRQLLFPFNLFMKKTVADGAQTTLYVALSTKMHHTGKYFDECRVAKESKHAMDDAACRELYDVSMQQVGLSQ